MNWKRLGISLFGAAFSVAMFAGQGHGLETWTDFACKTVRAVIDRDENWKTYEFVDRVSGEPISAEFSADNVRVRDSVFVYRTGRWRVLENAQTRVGSRVRIRHGETARINFQYNDCQEIIEPEDK